MLLCLELHIWLHLSLHLIHLILRLIRLTCLLGHMYLNLIHTFCLLLIKNLYLFHFLDLMNLMLLLISHELLWIFSELEGKYFSVLRITMHAEYSGFNNSLTISFAHLCESLFVTSLDVGTSLLPAYLLGVLHLFWETITFRFSTEAGTMHLILEEEGLNIRTLQKALNMRKSWSMTLCFELELMEQRLSLFLWVGKMLEWIDKVILLLQLGYLNLILFKVFNSSHLVSLFIKYWKQIPHRGEFIVCLQKSRAK